jgi:hypothetical protein
VRDECLQKPSEQVTPLDYSRYKSDCIALLIEVVEKKNDLHSGAVDVAPRKSVLFALKLVAVNQSARIRSFVEWAPCVESKIIASIGANFATWLAARFERMH